jgi:hypothetical protein
MNNQLVAQTATYTAQKTQERSSHVLSEIRTRDPSNQANIHLRLRQHGRLDRRLRFLFCFILFCFVLFYFIYFIVFYLFYFILFYLREKWMCCLEQTPGREVSYEVGYVSKSGHDH